MGEDYFRPLVKSWKPINPTLQTVDQRWEKPLRGSPEALP